METKVTRKKPRYDKGFLAKLGEERTRQEPGSPSFDSRKLFNHDGSLKNMNELDADTAAAIAGIEVFSFSKMPGKSRLRST